MTPSAPADLVERLDHTSVAESRSEVVIRPGSLRGVLVRLALSPTDSRLAPSPDDVLAGTTVEGG